MSDAPEGFELVLHPYKGVNMACDMGKEFLYWRQEWGEVRKFRLVDQGPQFNIDGLYFKEPPERSGPLFN